MIAGMASKLINSLAVADKPARRGASQTAKFYNSHVTITTPFCWWYVIPYIKFGVVAISSPIMKMHKAMQNVEIEVV